MAPLTGGCHYDLGCGKFALTCGSCPVLGSNVDTDLSRQVWGRKHSVLSKINPEQLQIVGTSRWIADQARKSSLLNRFPITVIPNGLNTTDFSPRDKRFSRDTLGVPQDAKVVLFVADSAAIVRKGFDYLAAALSGMKDRRDLFLLSVGGSKPNVPDIAQLHLGKISNDRNVIGHLQRRRRFCHTVASRIIRPNCYGVHGLRHAGCWVRHWRHPRHGSPGSDWVSGTCKRFDRPP